MNKKIFLLISCLMLLFSNLSVMVQAEDNEAPVITGVEVVSENGGDYDENPPRIDRMTANFNSGYSGISQTFIGQQGEGWLNITIFVEDELSGIKDVNLEISTPNGQKIYKANRTETNISSLSIPLFKEENGGLGIWEIKKITAEDHSGNVEIKELEDLHFYVLPKDYQEYNQHYLGLTDSHNTVKVSFSKEMDIQTINKENVILLKSTYDGGFYSHKPIKDYSINLGEDKKTLFIKNGEELIHDGIYVVIIHESVKDITGKKLGNPMFINFKYIPSTLTPLEGYSFFNNNKEQIIDSRPYEKSGHLLLSIRTLSEALNIQANWNSETEEITFKDDTVELIFQKGKNIAKYIENGITNEIQIPIPFTEINGRSYVPADIVVQKFGGILEFDKNNKIISINTEG